MGTVLVLLIAAGCRRQSAPPTTRPMAADQAADTARHDEALDYALHTLMHLEQYDTPEMIEQIINRLDQWIRDQQPLPNWKLDPLLEKLPAALQPVVERMKLDRLRFDKGDEQWLREAVWLHDISDWARGEAVAPLAQAEALFDWTMRNVALATNPHLLQKPWETILFGRGSATDRAWVFMLLLRQQGIDSALIAVVQRDPSGAQRSVPWAVGVLIDDQMYMFDPTLGVPVPSSDGLKRGTDGQLEIHPATLKELSGNDALLRRLDVPGEFQYPVTASQLEKVTAMIDVSPAYLAQRMAMLESKMAGRYQVVLTAKPSAQAERIKRCALIGNVLPWSLPYQIALSEQQPGSERSLQVQIQLMPFMLSLGVTRPLWRARQYHFKGILTGKPSATSYYQMARLPDRELQGDQIPRDMKGMLRVVKMFASYWLGVVALEQGNAASAIDYLKTRTIEAFPDGIWTHAATYRLGRAYELAGQPEKAIEVYRGDKQSLAYQGNVLRAKWLEQVVLGRPAKSAPKPTEQGRTQEKPQREQKPGDSKKGPPAAGQTSDSPSDRAQAAPAEMPPSEPGGKKNGGSRPQ